MAPTRIRMGIAGRGAVLKRMPEEEAAPCAVELHHTAAVVIVRALRHRDRVKAADLQWRAERRP